ncbi:MAG: stage II sporulation protein D [Acidobacteriota bacterium]
MKRRAYIIIAFLMLCTILIAKVTGPEPEIKSGVMIKLKYRDSISRVDLEEYLVGVVLAEMPGRFQTEALKAQAVCARTYTLKKYFDDLHHSGGAVVCDDPAHCQAYTDPNELLKNHPEKAWAVKKVRLAVRDTAGQVLVWNGQLIVTVYHSTCGGRTENSRYAWGRQYPYLISVPCQYDALSPYCSKTFQFATSDLKNTLNLKNRNRLTLSDWKYSPGGRVISVKFGGKTFTGRDLRTRLKLPSTKFQIAVSRGEIKITTHGYGHGVGLCQYGANGMGVRGMSYKQILYYYYRGVRLYEINKLGSL